jgi:hypothetical protein
VGRIGDAESVTYEPLLYRFDVVVERAEVDFDMRREQEAEAEWRALRSAYQLPNPCNPAERHLNGIRESDDELWLAYLVIAEIPTHIVEQYGCWFDTCDALGGVLRDFHEIIESRGADFAEGALLGRALLWPQWLGVHPRARGRTSASSCWRTDCGRSTGARVIWSCSKPPR